MDQIEQIKNFKQLLDEGIITQEEFEAKKKEILEAPAVEAPAVNYNDQYGNQGGYQGGYQQAGYQQGGYQQAGYSNAASSSSLSPKATAILSYFGLILWLIAYVIGDKEAAKFHLNQSLVITLFTFLTIIPFIGWLWAIFILVVWIMGLVYAIQFEEKPVPLIGGIQILK